MANDRFKTTYSVNKRRQESAQQWMSKVQGVSAQPVRKLDERFNAGKFKGTKVADAPQSYLKWVIDNWKGITKDQVNLIKKHIK